MIYDNEKVVRVLFPNKILHGRVMGGAFILRTQRKEESISVFRMSGPTFHKDINRLDANRNLYCCVLQVSDIRGATIIQGENRIQCDIIETGDINETSHAGITISINNQQLVGGQESDIILKEKSGSTVDALILAMQHRLAGLAQKGLARVNDLTSEHTLW